MAAPLEKLLDYLVKDGLLTREKADECLRTRAEAVEKGENSSMTDIVVSKGGVDPARLSMALLSVKQVALICPKCRKRHTTKNASLDMVYPCKRCGTPLEAEEIVPSGSGPIRKLEDPSPREVVEARRDPKRIFGKYTLLQELGRGGYAVVYKAWDSLLAQYVALKLIRSEEEGLTDAPRAGEAEILREARMAARLSHPHIVRIWEVGTQGDRHFLSMEYVEGKSLARLLRPEGKSPRLPAFYSSMKRVLVILRDVARALHHAHSNRPPIVHRDVKPQNILVDPKGRACLVDFGLAREMTRSGGRLTVTGVTKGTPCYMAPEQALGRAAEVDARTDVWALGAILYEFLAGKPPFRGSTDREILNQVVHEDPRRPSDVLQAEGLRAPPFVDLEKVCLKALEKDRSRRYATAEEFAAEIDRFLSGQTVQAKIASGAAQFIRWIGRRKALSAAVTAAVVMSGVALGLLVRGGGPPQVVERVVVEKDPSARLSRAAREIERLAAEFQYDLALRKYQELIDGEPDAVERGLLRQRLEDVRLQRAVLEGLVQRIQKEPRDYPAFRLKAGFPEPCRVIDANLERLLLRRRSEHEEAAWGQLDPRQFAALVRDYWPRIEGRAALGFGVWCLRQGLTEEAAAVFERQPEPQAQRYLDELAVRSAGPASTPDAAGESPRDRILRQAEEALTKGDFVIARARFERVLMIKPGDADAMTGLQRTAEVEKSTQEAQAAAPKPAVPEATPAPGLPPLDPLPAPAANAPEAGPTAQQIRAFEWHRKNASSSLRSRNLVGAASEWLTALGKNEADASQWGPSLNRIVGGNPGAPEVRAALTEVEKLLALEIREPEAGVKLLFDLRDLFAVSLVYGEVVPAVDRVIQAREVIELRSFGGRVKLGTLERVRGTLTFSETLMSGGQKATIGWPVNLWGGAGTRLNASDLVALVRKDRNKRAVATGWRDHLGEGLVLLYEGAIRSAADSPELQEAQRLASEDDRRILRMSEYVRLSAASASEGAAADPAPGENPDRLLSSGVAKNAAGDYRGSIEDLNKAVALNASDPSGYYSRAFPRMNVRDFAGAISDCDRAIQLAGPQASMLPYYLSARAQVKRLQGDLDGAIADYTQAIVLKANFADPYRDRGMLVHRKGQWAAAVADLTRAMELAPNRAEDHFIRARCHYDAGSWESAAADCRRAIELGVKNEDYTRLYLWMSQARMGQAASARGDLRGYFLRRPSDPAQVAWFKRVAALLVDDLTEDGLLKQAEGERDERLKKEYLCEAWFYAGTKRLLAGDASGAATLFQRSMDTKIETFMEYTSSLAELDRLGIARPAAKAALAKLPAAWEATQGGWYYRSLKTDYNGVLEIRPREGYLLGIGWVRTDKDYNWIQVGVPAGDTCRWIFINQQGERGSAEYRLKPALSVLGTWTYGAVSRPIVLELARPTRAYAVLDGALRSLASRSEKDMFKSEAEARAWIEQALAELRR